MNLVVDVSAALAILLSEADAEEYLTKLEAASQVWISPVNGWDVQVSFKEKPGAAGEGRAGCARRGATSPKPRWSAIRYDVA
jgi:uncharacterized protein with PIN domain